MNPEINIKKEIPEKCSRVMFTFRRNGEIVRTIWAEVEI